MISLSRATRKQFMVASSRAWYNGSYTMAAKLIKTLELHYTNDPVFNKCHYPGVARNGMNSSYGSWVHFPVYFKEYVTEVC